MRLNQKIFSTHLPSRKQFGVSAWKNPNPTLLTGAFLKWRGFYIYITKSAIHFGLDTCNYFTPMCMNQEDAVYFTQTLLSLNCGCSKSMHPCTCHANSLPKRIMALEMEKIASRTASIRCACLFRCGSNTASCARNAIDSNGCIESVTSLHYLCTSHGACCLWGPWQLQSLQVCAHNPSTMCIIPINNCNAAPIGHLPAFEYGLPSKNQTEQGEKCGQITTIDGVRKN